MGNGKGIEVGKKCSGMRIKRLDEGKGELKSKFGKRQMGDERGPHTSHKSWKEA